MLRHCVSYTLLDEQVLNIIFSVGLLSSQSGTATYNRCINKLTDGLTG